MTISPVAHAASSPPPALAKTAREFEAVFAGQVAKLMLESVDRGEFGGGQGEEIFRGMLAERLGDELAKGRGLGLASVVLAQMQKLQEQGQ